MIRIHSADRATPVMLDFGSAFGDRDAIRDVLNRRLTPAGAAGGAGAAARASQAPGASLAPPPVIDWSSLTPEERKWRQLLMKRREVASLHRNLVASQIVDEDKFWKGMKCKFKPNGQRGGPTAAEIEKLGEVGASKGVPSAAFVSSVDSSGDGIEWRGEVPSSAERHRIFMEFPAVSLAYRAKVLDARPGVRMTEASFWKVYKTSSMAQRHIKGTKRAAAVATEADAMFAEFTARESKAMQAAEHELATQVDSSINIDRFDDHRQPHVLDARSDALLQPPKQRRGRGNSVGESRGLDLMRKLNTHGSMVLDGLARQSRFAWREDEDARAHPLRHLEGEATPEYAKLAVQDERAFLAAQAGRAVQKEQDTNKEELANLALYMSQQMESWDPGLTVYADGGTRNNIVLSGILHKINP